MNKNIKIKIFRCLFCEHVCTCDFRTKCFHSIEICMHGSHSIGRFNTFHCWCFAFSHGYLFSLFFFRPICCWCTDIIIRIFSLWIFSMRKYTRVTFHLWILNLFEEIRLNSSCKYYSNWNHSFFFLVTHNERFTTIHQSFVGKLYAFKFPCDLQQFEFPYFPVSLGHRAWINPLVFFHPHVIYPSAVKTFPPSAQIGFIPIRRFIFNARFSISSCSCVVCIVCHSYCIC